MGEIKSALEIAMERTQSVKGDKEQVQAYEHKNKGKQLGSRFLGNPDINIKKVLKEYNDKEKKWVKEGVFQILISNLTLPRDKEDVNKLRHLQKGFEYIIPSKQHVQYLFQQLENIFNQFLQDRERVSQQLKQQFAQKLRQKEEEISKQLGREIHLDPSSDQEYNQYLNRQMGNLENHYAQVLEQAKNQFRSLYS